MNKRRRESSEAMGDGLVFIRCDRGWVASHESRKASSATNTQIISMGGKGGGRPKQRLARQRTEG
jgi:hypothetical protein